MINLLGHNSDHDGFCLRCGLYVPTNPECARPVLEELRRMSLVNLRRVPSYAEEESLA